MEYPVQLLGRPEAVRHIQTIVLAVGRTSTYRISSTKTQGIVHLLPEKREREAQYRSKDSCCCTRTRGIFECIDKVEEDGQADKEGKWSVVWQMIRISYKDDMTPEKIRTSLASMSVTPDAESLTETKNPRPHNGHHPVQLSLRWPTIPAKTSTFSSE